MAENITKEDKNESMNAMNWLCFRVENDFLFLFACVLNC